MKQQGDVILRKLKSIPPGDKTDIQTGKLTLAFGERTGHSHTIEDEKSELFTVGNKRVLVLDENATLVHQEHKPISLEAGIWEVGIVKEYDYFSKMVRPVTD